MIKEIIMPKLGQTVEESTVGKWLKKEGDKVEKGDIMDFKKTDYWEFLKDVKESDQLDKLLELLNKIE